MTTQQQPKPGARFSRWTFVRYSTPAQRRPSDHGVRQRGLARCVCGYERIVWLEDLTRGRSTGCPKGRCRARFDVAEELRALATKMRHDAARFGGSAVVGGVVDGVLEHVDAWVRTGRERDESAAVEAIEREEQRRAAREARGDHE